MRKRSLKSILSEDLDKAPWRDTKQVENRGCSKTKFPWAKVSKEKFNSVKTSAVMKQLLNDIHSCVGNSDNNENNIYHDLKK